MKRIGVLALQGSVEEHAGCLKRAGAEPVPVKSADDLQHIGGLVIPGGESTTLGILLREFEMLEPLKKVIRDGLPVWGTCAGMILLAKRIVNQSGSHLGLMDMAVSRNGFGSQLDSFSGSAAIAGVSDRPIPLVFIRAPYITEVWGDCNALCTLDGRIVAARQGSMLATAFHPELTCDLSFYTYFLRMAGDTVDSTPNPVAAL